jgi:hypothetical protein
MATRQQVARFLESFKRSIAEVGWLWVLNRERNRDGLIAVGITKKQREEVIRSLSPEITAKAPYPTKRNQVRCGFSASTSRVLRSTSSSN